MIAADKKAKIERALGRALSKEELETTPQLDSLPIRQVEVLAAVRATDLIAASFYVEAVVPSCSLDVVNRLVRALAPSERVVVLSRMDVLVALTYLGELVPSKQGAACEAYASELAASCETPDLPVARSDTRGARDRQRIEDALGRALVPAELTAVGSEGGLTSQQVALVETLAGNQLVVGLYMSAIAPREPVKTLIDYICFIRLARRRESR